MKDKTEKEAWLTLTLLAKADDMAAFWKAYAEYLESRNIHSLARTVLFIAANKTVKALEEK